MQINGSIERDLLITEDTLLSGILTGRVVITNMATFTVRGIHNGDIEIPRGSKLNANGIVNGDIINSGTCNITGIVNGELIDNGGIFNVDTEAIVQPAY